MFSIFGWFYPARIVRAQLLSIREKEFIEAARMIGASDWRIIRSHVLPHLVAPDDRLLDAHRRQPTSSPRPASRSSASGSSCRPPSWGNLLATAPEFYTQRPMLMVWPGLAVLLTTLAFNLLGDGLRDAFDPRGGR